MLIVTVLSFYKLVLKVLNLRMIHPCFCDWITTWGSLEWRLMREIDPKCVLEVALAVVCQSFIDYVQYERYFASPPVFYEDLVSLFYYFYHC